MMAPMDKRPKFNLWYLLPLAAITAFGVMIWITQAGEEASSTAPGSASVATGPAEITNPAGAFASPAAQPNSRYRQVMQRIRHQRMLIHQGLRNKTLTLQQSRTYMNSLRAIITKMREYSNQQPNRELTVEQQSELYQMLDSASGTLGETNSASHQAP